MKYTIVLVYVSLHKCVESKQTSGLSESLDVWVYSMFKYIPHLARGNQTIKINKREKCCERGGGGL